MKVAIVGYPGSGKTTIFNALTGLNVPTGPHGDERSPRLGVIKVPDERVDALGEMLKLRKRTHAEITFLDFPLDREGKALNPHRIAQMKEADALAQVVRCFPDSGATPVDEIRDFGAELKLSDLEIIENRLARLKKEKGHPQEKDLLERCKAFIEEEKPLRMLRLSEEEKKMLSGFGFLSQKALLIVLNLSEEQLGASPTGELKDALARESLEALPICGKMETELAQLEEVERLDFLKELGIQESARDRFVRSCYALLDLISFLTHNEEEVRAWSIRRGTSALKAAGRVHSDMERGFIRAEIVHFEDFVRHGSEAKCREAGKLRLEGKDYMVKDGDIIRFRFHV